MKRLIYFVFAISIASGVDAQHSMIETIAVPALVHMDLDPLGNIEIGLNELLGDQLSLGSVIEIWDSTTRAFTAYSNGVSGWPGEQRISYGSIFFVKPPTSSVIELRGVSPTPSAIVQSNITGSVSLGYPYPTRIAWTNTTLIAQASRGSKVQIWNWKNAAYTSYVRLRSGWAPSLDDLWIEPGQAFGYECHDVQTWIETRPLSLP